VSDIDHKPLHPKNKLLLYNRYVLSKISWHLTVAPLSKTWVTETIDSVINQYIRKWLEIPISGTLSNIYLTRNKFGLNILPASVKFIQDSILNFLAETFQTIIPCRLYADLSGDIYQPDLLLITPNENLYVVELTVRV
jgi:hypothetical protein